MPQQTAQIFSPLAGQKREALLQRQLSANQRIVQLLEERVAAHRKAMRPAIDRNRGDVAGRIEIAAEERAADLRSNGTLEGFERRGQQRRADGAELVLHRRTGRRR